MMDAATIQGHALVDPGGNVFKFLFVTAVSHCHCQQILQGRATSDVVLVVFDVVVSLIGRRRGRTPRAHALFVPCRALCVVIDCPARCHGASKRCLYSFPVPATS